MTTTAADFTVRDAIRRTLTAATAYGHDVPGLIDRPPRQRASGVCLRCLLQTHVHYGGHDVTVEGMLARAYCAPSPARVARVDEGEGLHDLAFAARDDARFLAHPLHLDARAHGLSRGEVAARVEVPRQALDRLCLYPVPAPPLTALTPVLVCVGRETGARPSALAHVLTEVAPLVQAAAHARYINAHAARIAEATVARDAAVQYAHTLQAHLDALCAEV